MIAYKASRRSTALVQSLEREHCLFIVPLQRQMFPHESAVRGQRKYDGRRVQDQGCPLRDLPSNLSSTTMIATGSSSLSTVTSANGSSSVPAARAYTIGTFGCRLRRLPISRFRSSISTEHPMITASN